MSKLKMEMLFRNSILRSSSPFIKPSGGGLNSYRGMATGVAAALPSQGSEFVPNVRVFAPYTIFKGKAALSAQMLSPRLSKLENGDYRVKRPGVIMLTLWPAIGERKYDWEKRQQFALSVNEVGSVISLGSKQSCEFFHDPSMKSSNEGKVRKSLSIKLHDDGSGCYFISLSVANSVLKTSDRLSVPVAASEFAVLRAAFTFALPQLLGWDQFNNQKLPTASTTAASKKGEWDR